MFKTIKRLLSGATEKRLPYHHEIARPGLLAKHYSFCVGVYHLLCESGINDSCDSVMKSLILTDLL